MEIVKKGVPKQLNSEIPPFINELVDTLDTEQLNSLLEKENVQVDKKTFLMFVITFFITKLFCEKDQGETLDKKEIKAFLTEILLTNPDSRHKCMELFLQFHQVLKI